MHTRAYVCVYVCMCVCVCVHVLYEYHITRQVNRVPSNEKKSSVRHWAKISCNWAGQFIATDIICSHSDAACIT